MVFDTFHACLPEASKLRRRWGYEVPSNLFRCEVILEIRVPQDLAYSPGQFPVGPLEFCPVVAIDIRRKASAGRESVKGSKETFSRIIISYFKVYRAC